MQVRITYDSMVRSHMLHLKSTFQLIGIELYSEPEIAKEAIDYQISRLGSSGISLGRIDVPITWAKKVRQYRKQNKFFLQRVSKNNSDIHSSRIIAPTGIFYMPYDWFEFRPFYYNTQHGFITEHHKRLMSRKVQSLRIEDDKYTYITEDAVKKKQAYELWHEIINQDDVRERKRAAAMEVYEKTCAAIDNECDIANLERELLYLDPLGKISEEYEMVKDKLLN